LVCSHFDFSGRRRRQVQMRKHLDTRRGRTVVVAMLLIAVVAIAVPTAALGKSSRAAGSCNGMEVNSFSPKSGKRHKTVVTVYGSHLDGNHYFGMYFKANDPTGRVFVPHSDLDMSHLGDGWFTARVPDTAVTGPIRIRDGSGCDFSISNQVFRVIDAKG